MCAMEIKVVKFCNTDIDITPQMFFFVVVDCDIDKNARNEQK